MGSIYLASFLSDRPHLLCPFLLASWEVNFHSVFLSLQVVFTFVILMHTINQAKTNQLLFRIIEQRGVYRDLSLSLPHLTSCFMACSVLTHWPMCPTCLPIHRNVKDLFFPFCVRVQWLHVLFHLNQHPTPTELLPLSAWFFTVTRRILWLISPLHPWTRTALRKFMPFIHSNHPSLKPFAYLLVIPWTLLPEADANAGVRKIHFCVSWEYLLCHIKGRKRAHFTWGFCSYPFWRNVPGNKCSPEIGQTGGGTAATLSVMIAEFRFSQQALGKESHTVKFKTKLKTYCRPCPSPSF